MKEFELKKGQILVCRELAIRRRFAEVLMAHDLELLQKVREFMKWADEHRPLFDVWATEGEKSRD